MSKDINNGKLSQLRVCPLRLPFLARHLFDLAVNNQVPVPITRVSVKEKLQVDMCAHRRLRSACASA